MITLIIFNVFYIGIINMCWIACNAGILVYYFVVYWILLMSWWLIVIVTSFNDCIYLIVVFFIECSDNFMILQCVIKMCQKCQKCHKQIDWISQTLSTFSIRVIQCHLTILSEQHKFLKWCSLLTRKWQFYYTRNGTVYQYKRCNALAHYYHNW